MERRGEREGAVRRWVGGDVKLGAAAARTGWAALRWVAVAGPKDGGRWVLGQWEGVQPRTLSAG